LVIIWFIKVFKFNAHFLNFLVIPVIHLKLHDNKAENDIQKAEHLLFSSLTELVTAGCHGNLPVLNLLTVSVAKNQHFRPCRKNYALDRKMIDTF